ncbi:GMC family oxidoreductase N-terminal domain-containing protein [Rhizobium nepotum]|uniref:GMC family oxidoreductase N-terminal domain-containing protein n=1 Tax=Rhizobium nepotum TaxID=1035271 RepID=UPI003CFA929C
MTADGYLRPALGRGNLEVLSNASVQRRNRKRGRNRHRSHRRQGSRQIVCDREVILCAGTFNSPQLLMLSGIGDPDHLRKHGITLKAEARQVGRNLENHPGVNLEYSTNYEDFLVSELNLFGQAKLGADWLLRKKGLARPTSSKPGHSSKPVKT